MIVLLGFRQDGLPKVTFQRLEGLTDLCLSVPKGTWSRPCL